MKTGSLLKIFFAFVLAAVAGAKESSIRGPSSDVQDDAQRNLMFNALNPGVGGRPKEEPIYEVIGDKPKVPGPPLKQIKPPSPGQYISHMVKCLIFPWDRSCVCLSMDCGMVIGVIDTNPNMMVSF